MAKLDRLDLDCREAVRGVRVNSYMAKVRLNLLDPVKQDIHQYLRQLEENDNQPDPT